MYRFVILSGFAKGKSHDLAAPETTIGREDGQTIVLEDDDVSRSHAALTRNGNAYRLRDLHSANGTRVNGKLITEIDLQDGDQVAFGLVKTRFEKVPPAASPGNLKRTAPIREADLKFINDGVRADELQKQNTAMTAQLAELRRSLETASGEAVQRVERTHAARVRVLTRQLEEVTRRNSELVEELALLEEKNESRGRDATEQDNAIIQRLRSDLALARALLFTENDEKPTLRAPLLDHPSLRLPPVPAGTLALPATMARPVGDSDADELPALPERPAERVPLRQVIGVIGLVMLVATFIGFIVWDWNQKQLAAIETTPHSKRRPATVVQAEATRQIPELNASIPTAPDYPDDLKNRIYRDPHGRFAFIAPPGWIVDGSLGTPDESRVVLRHGRDEIEVVSYGNDWPDLTVSDQTAVERALTSRLRATHASGMYAQIVAAEWRTVEGTRARQFDIDIAYTDYKFWARTVEYRHQGRANSVELRVYSEDRPLLVTVFEDFMKNIHTSGSDEPVTTSSRWH